MTATARQAALHLQPTPGTDLALANGLLHIAITEGCVDEDVRGRAHRPASTRSGGPWPRTGRRGSSGSPAYRSPTLRRRSALPRPTRTGRSCSPPAAPSSTPRAPTPSPRSSTWRSPSACPAVPGSGYGCLTGQGNGQGGREHGQKADQLPGYRRIDDPAARAHVAARLGRRPRTTCPARAAPRTSCCDSLGTAGRAARAAGVRLQPGRVGAPAPAAIERAAALAGPAGRRRLRALGDGRAGRRRAADRPVGRGGRHDDQPGGPGAAPPPAVAPPPGVRTDLEVLAGLAGRLRRRRAGSRPTRPRSSTSCARATRAGIADYAGITYERIDAETGVFWPCPGRGPPGHAAAVPRPVRHPRRPGPVRAVEHAARAEETCADYPLYLTTGRVLAHYQSGAQTRRIAALQTRRPSRSSSCTPTWPSPARHRRRRRRCG